MAEQKNIGVRNSLAIERPKRSVGGPADAVAAWAEAKRDLGFDAGERCTPDQQTRVIEKYHEKWGGNIMGTAIQFPDESDSGQDPPGAESFTEVKFGEIGKSALAE
jgi:hypothetical protein